MTASLTFPPEGEGTIPTPMAWEDKGLQAEQVKVRAAAPSSEAAQPLILPASLGPSFYLGGEENASHPIG